MQGFPDRRTRFSGLSFLSSPIRSPVHSAVRYTNRLDDGRKGREQIFAGIGFAQAKGDAFQLRGADELSDEADDRRRAWALVARDVL